MIYVAANGRDLLAQIEQNDHVPDLALVDLHMPEMDGFEATAQLRHLYPTARVLIVSISDLEQDIAESVRNGVKGYLIKGVNQMDSSGHGWRDDKRPLFSSFFW